MNQESIFRKAVDQDLDSIWNIIQFAIELRKVDGSNQWQDGYPNRDIIRIDIEKEAGYVLVEGDKIAGYVALIINDEPEYSRLKGEWLSNGDFVVFHRVAIASSHLGRGLAKELFHKIEEYTREKGITSIKADTNFDNHAMIFLFDKFGYSYCGEVTFRGSARRAYEKVLK